MAEKLFNYEAMWLFAMKLMVAPRYVKKTFCLQWKRKFNESTLMLPNHATFFTRLLRDKLSFFPKIPYTARPNRTPIDIDLGCKQIIRERAAIRRIAQPADWNHMIEQSHASRSYNLAVQNARSMQQCNYSTTWLSSSPSSSVRSVWCSKDNGLITKDDNDNHRMHLSKHTADRQRWTAPVLSYLAAVVGPS